MGVERQRCLDTQQQQQQCHKAPSILVEVVGCSETVFGGKPFAVGHLMEGAVVVVG